jgi:phospholipid/cholesterol/gamma-HCH transport system substrate-binding protein
MDERKKQFRVGVVVFATAIITVVLILMSSDFSWSPFRSQYQLQILVDQAPGVAPDTPVRRRGVLIGRVASVVDTDTGALITLNIDGNKEIKSNEVARITTSLIGDAIIDFSPAGPAANAVVVKPGGPPLRGVFVPSPLDLLSNMQGDLKIAIQSLGEAGQQVAELAGKLNSVIGDTDMDRLKQVMDSADAALTNFGRVMADVEDVLGDEQFKADLRQGLTQIPQVVSDAREILAVLERTLASADKNLQNLQGLTGPLGERGPELVNRMEASIDNLSQVFAEAALLAKNVNSGEGTIGKLLRDQELYDRLGNTVNEAQAAIRDVRMMINSEFIQRRIQQILDNIWVLTDKLARDPARIARGIVPKNRETPVK